MVKLSNEKAKSRRPPKRPARPAPAPAPVTDDDVRLRAYQIFLDRGSVPGRDLEDWLQAEQELRGS